MSEKKVIIIGVAVILGAWAIWQIWRKLNAPITPWPEWATTVPGLSPLVMGVDFTSLDPAPSLLGWPLKPPDSARTLEGLTKTIMEGRLRPS